MIIIIDLIYSLALLVALSVVSGFIGHRWKREQVGALLQGVVFGGAAVIGMLHPLVLEPGLFFDGRSVMISLCGLFFGPAAVTVATAMALICRILQGGMGVIMGVSVILSSALLGLIFHHRQIRRDVEFSAIQLLGFGLIVHIVMILLVFTLPCDVVFITLKRIGLPVLLTYPLATALVGKILSDHAARERSRKETELERERFRTLVNNAPFGMVLIGKDKDFLLINPIFRELFGYGKTNVPNGREWFRKAFPDPEYRSKVIATWIADEKNAQQGEARPRIFTVTCKNGEKKAISFIPVELTDGDQLVTMVDMTREMRLENRFHQTERLESVGRLAAGVAHDLNNLLTPILGNAELILLDLDQTTKNYRRIQGIKQAAEHSRDLIRQLLAFGRKQILEIRVLDLHQVVGDMESLIRRTIREDIKLNIFFCPEPCQVSADASQIGQILMNLCVNAQDAMPDGGNLTIEVVHVQLDENAGKEQTSVTPGDYVMLAISDTGFGMNKETQQHIFEPFFTTKKELGTGLGLATVYGIVKQHGGNIWVYSEPEKGTTFKVYLPAVQAEIVASERSFQSEKDIHGSETILVVEDNETVRDVACSILERLGYAVLSAAGGKNALNLLSQHSSPVNLLLTDVVMPDMDGKTLFGKISQNRPDIRVLFMSGYTQNVIAHHGVLDEGVHFIQKPFSYQTLAAKVREALCS